MKTPTLVTAIAAGLVSFPLAAQPPEGYVDVDIVHVKQGKRTDFDALNKRLVDMNRKSGNHWTTNAVDFGDTNVFYFIMPYATFAATAQGIRSFGDAVRRAVGDAGVHKFFNDLDATIDREHYSMYRRRWDLSTHVPADDAAYDKIVGEARWIRMVTTYTRPGKTLDYEQQLRENKDANERMNPGIPFWVSQSVAGEPPGTFRTVNLMKTLDDMDKLKNTQQVRGDSYSRYMQVVSESVERTEITISHLVPALSNPPDGIANVDTSFWRPKPAPVVASAKKEPVRQ